MCGDTRTRGGSRKWINYEHGASENRGNRVYVCVKTPSCDHRETRVEKTRWEVTQDIGKRDLLFSRPFLSSSPFSWSVRNPPSSPPLLPSGEKKHSDPSRYIYLSYRFDRWKCARFNNVDIAILICNTIMYGFSIRVIVKIIGNEAQGRKGWKMFKYFRRYILVLKSWDRKGIIIPRIETNSSAFFFYDSEDWWIFFLRRNTYSN